MDVRQRPMRIVVTEDGTRSVLRFQQSVVRIGRALDNEMRLSGKLVSRNHCRIELDEAGSLSVVDLNSANGTEVNGDKIDRRRLAPGDEVRVGSARIQVEVEDDPADFGETQRLDAVDAEGAGAVGLTTQAGDAVQERENLRVFARITQALLRETELQPLLRQIVDSAVTLVGAERGFLLLREDAGETRPPDATPPQDASALKARVARTFDMGDIPVPSSRLSIGIADQVVQSARPVLSVDAGRDDRFKGMASVEDLRLRSVLCIPVTLDGVVEGVLYVDNRLQQGVFSEDDLDLVELLAGQAALAVRNARVLADQKRQNVRLLESRAQIERLNEQLGRKVRDRDTELAVVRAELERERGRYDYSQIVGASEGMRRVFQQLDKIIESDLPVYVHGESGTGKELIARAIHFNGASKDRPFVSENCAALPDTLLESELFGHTRGAFTGADRAKKGLIEQADGGTLFLDEIGDMSSEMQKKLLRVLQEGEVRPLGSSKTVVVDVRVIAASHRDLEEMVQAGRFREDLYYRINVLQVRLPPLRERREDVPLLAEALLARAAREAGRPVPVLPHDVQAALVAYDWPGNVRELENEMRRIVVMAGETVHLDLLSPTILSHREDGDPAGRLLELGGDLRAAVADFEVRAIRAALEQHAGNKSQAAKALGISRFALQRKLGKYGLEGDEADPDADPDGEPDAPATEGS